MTTMSLFAAAVSLGLMTGVPGLTGASMAATPCLVLLAMFPACFQAANASFAKPETIPAAVAEELTRWARWHQVRTAIALIAFVCSVYAVAA